MTYESSVHQVADNNSIKSNLLDNLIFFSASEMITKYTNIKIELTCLNSEKLSQF